MSPRPLRLGSGAYVFHLLRETGRPACGARGSIVAVPAEGRQVTCAACTRTAAYARFVAKSAPAPASHSEAPHPAAPSTARGD